MDDMAGPARLLSTARAAAQSVHRNPALTDKEAGRNAWLSSRLALKIQCGSNDRRHEPRWSYAARAGADEADAPGVATAILVQAVFPLFSCLATGVQSRVRSKPPGL